MTGPHTNESRRNDSSFPDYCKIEFLKGKNSCKYGKKCKFSHDIDFNKNDICKFAIINENRCKYGKNCKWSHQIPNILKQDGDFVQTLTSIN